MQGRKTPERDYNKVCWSDEVTFHIGEDRNVYYVTRASKKDKDWLEKNLSQVSSQGGYLFVYSLVIVEMK